MPHCLLSQCLILSMLWTLYFGLLSAFAPVYGWILVLQGLVGIGLGGSPQSWVFLIMLHLSLFVDIKLFWILPWHMWYYSVPIKINMWPWTTKAVLCCIGIFLQLPKIYIVGQNCRFYFYDKYHCNINPHSLKCSLENHWSVTGLLQDFWPLMTKHTHTYIVINDTEVTIYRSSLHKGLIKKIFCTLY